MKSRSSYWTVLPYIALVSLVSLLSFLRPSHNADMLGYIASVYAFESKDQVDFQEIHRQTYAELERSVSPYHFQSLTALNNYLADLYKNPAHLGETMAFYSVKPLYILAAEAIHRLGISLPRATGLVSILSYLGLAWLLWRWIGWPAYLVMLAPPVFAVVRHETPDELNLLLVMLALYLICEKRRYIWGATILVVSIWCRPDMVIMSGGVLAALWLAKRLDIVEVGLLSILALGSYWAVMHYAGNYGWSVLFEHTFLRDVYAPGEEVFRVTPRIYLETAFDHLRSLEFQNHTPDEAVQSSLLLFVIFAAMAVRYHGDRVYRLVTLATIPAIAVHFLGMPSLYFRLYAPMYLFMMVSFICSLRRMEQLTVKSPDTLRSEITSAMPSPQLTAAAKAS